MNQSFLSLGSNLGERMKMLTDAIQLLRKEVGTVKTISSIYETAAWGNTKQPPFLNAVILLETNLNATDLLNKILSIEKKLGRERKQKWEARTIDIDILYFNNDVLKQDELIIPHPFLHERKFILEPLNEIAPLFIHPVFEIYNSQLLKNCIDKLSTQKIANEISSAFHSPSTF